MFNDKTTSALHAWLGRPTWHTLDALDEQRFFAFVDAVWEEKHGLWDEMAARNFLLPESQRLDPDLDEEHRTRVIDSRRKDAAVILQFLTYANERGRT